MYHVGKCPPSKEGVLDVFLDLDLLPSSGELMVIFPSFSDVGP